MIKGVKIVFNAKEYGLLFSGAATFAIEDFLGDEKLTDILFDFSAANWDKIAKIIAIMAEQWELVRRHYGYDPQEMLQEEQLRLLARPLEIAQMRVAASRAFFLGWGREIQPDDKEETDLVLLELQKKSN